VCNLGAPQTGGSSKTAEIGRSAPEMAHSYIIRFIFVLLLENQI